MKHRLVEYREVQRFTQWWIVALLIALAGLAWWAFLQQVVMGQPWGSRPAPNAVIWGLVAIHGVLLPGFLLSMRLTTTIEGDTLVARYFPLRTRRVKLSEILRAEAVTYRPIREYGGWGIRWGGPRNWAYNLRGNRGVRLTLRDGATLLVGSQRAEDLAESLRLAGVNVG